MSQKRLTLTERYAAIFASLAAGYIELGVEGGGILWDIRLPQGARR